MINTESISPESARFGYDRCLPSQRAAIGSLEIVLDARRLFDVEYALNGRGPATELVRCQAQLSVGLAERLVQRNAGRRLEDWIDVRVPLVAVQPRDQVR